MAKKKTTKKTTRKKAPARRTSSRTTAKKTPTRKKAPARKTTTKKTAARSTKKKTAKKSAAKKTTKKKTTKKKTTAKKAATKKKTKKTAAKKTTTKKTTAKKSTAKKTTKAASKKKTTTKKTTKKKTTRRRSAGARSVAEAASAGKADARGYVFVNGRRVRMISTGGLGTTKKSSTRRVTEDEPETAKSTKLVKTKLTTKELNHYKKLLLAKRLELIGDVNSMETAALQSGGGNLSNLPIHMADIGSDTYEQDFTLGLAETERARLREIEEALLRIKARTYGVCQMTGEPIPKARLDAKPWAKYTIEAARKLEGQWRPG